MPALAIILVLISAITHTTWNSLSKNITASCKTIMMANFLSIIVFIPLSYFVKDDLGLYKTFLIPGAITGITNALAFWGLLAAYRAGDLSFVYPLKNALPILYSTIFGIIIGKAAEISPIAYIGFAFIIVGCVLLPIENPKIITVKTFLTKSILFTAIAAMGTAVYSNVDSSIINNIKTIAPHLSNFQIGILYIPYMAFTTALFLLPFMFADKKFYNVDFRAEKNNYLMLFLMGIFINVGYMLVFIAYGIADNVNYVVAFRQTGMVLTMLVGFIVLKEKPYPCKVTGGLMILSGLILTALF
ncbi:MAG: EamA family transporter [Armatimonadetes bacterium]|nr:EamA family transporter [Candidatus Hippobium faecium]